MKTVKFFVFFGSITGILLGIYLILNLGLEILIGLTYIPLPYYILYGVGSLITIFAAIFASKKFNVKLIGIWGIATAVLAIIVSCFYNWNALSKLFLKVLPVEAIVGFLFCFVIVIFSGFLSKVLFSKEGKNNSNNFPT